jgi:uncharacterized OB-fold protein
MNDLVEEFRAGLARGELLIQSCGSCNTRIMYPRYRCPACQSDELSYVGSGGVGTLHSYTIIRAVPPRGFEDDLPYALGVVKLDEGVQLLARLHPSADTGGWDGYACDQRVQFAPVSADEVARRPVAWFGPASAEPRVGT